jgi:hypothetical protein
MQCKIYASPSASEAKPGVFGSTHLQLDLAGNTGERARWVGWIKVEVPAIGAAHIGRPMSIADDNQSPQTITGHMPSNPIVQRVTVREVSATCSFAELLPSLEVGLERCSGKLARWSRCLGTLIRNYGNAFDAVASALRPNCSIVRHGICDRMLDLKHRPVATRGHSGASSRADVRWI